MSNEASLRDRINDPINMACVDGLGMEKGTILAFSGPRGVKPSAADNDTFAGILHREKIAFDGRTQVPVHIDGVFDCTFTGSIVAQGSDVTISGPNILKIFTTGDSEDGTVVGKILEASTALSLEVNQVLLKH